MKNRQPLRVVVVGFLAVVVWALPAFARKPLPELHSVDYKPNPLFNPDLHSSTHDTGPMGAVKQHGEVVILEGDSTLVSEDGNGGYGIFYGQAVQQPVDIAQRFYTKYADEFDELIILTTFDDNGSPGALAYEISAQQDIKGLGKKTFDDSGVDGWGAADHKLHAFVNMMRWNQYENIDGVAITSPNSGFYTTLGQEFAHRWLSFLHYQDASGKYSSAMLGRDLAHWASTLQADASVMDGNKWRDNNDGTFTVTETFVRYSLLDMYAMGLVEPTEVPPWFLITNATSASSGNPINTGYPLRVGYRAKGTREEIKIEQVVAAEGPRTPSATASPHDFRVAFVLVTRPGETASQVTAIAAVIDQMRKVWEQQFGVFTGGRATMCTQVSAPCGAPTAKVTDGSITEKVGNKNGVVEPGEDVSVSFTLNNDSPANAKPVGVTVDGGVGVKLKTDTATVDAIAPGESVAVHFSGSVPAEAVCGETISVNVEATIDGVHKFRGSADVVPGLTQLFRYDFENDSADLKVNADGKDGTTMNGWQYGTPVEYGGRNGWIFQPGAGHSGVNAWFTGLQLGHRAVTDSSVGNGITTLTTPDYDITRLYKPSLRFWAWFQAIDFTNPQQGGQVFERASLIVEGSTDEGKSWFALDEIKGAETSWQLREVPLTDKLGTGKTLRVRFSTEGVAPTIIIEAGVDDLEIRTLTQSCNPDANKPPVIEEPPVPPAARGCACSVARPATSAEALTTLALALLVALALHRRRR